MRRVKLLRAYKMDDPLIVGDTGEELRLRDFVASFVVQQGDAIYLDEEPQPGPSRVELEKQETEIQAGTLKQVSEDEPMKRPYGNAPKAAWVRYAAHGDHGQPFMSEERAEGLTKADLMSKFGERL